MKLKEIVVAITMCFIFAAVISACNQMMNESTGAPEVTEAIALLHPTQGSTVKGTVVFSKVNGDVKVVADVEGLTPGKHGFHIHEYGDCSAADATSAGGHFNPETTAHGAPTDEKRHLGDLGNITADADGKAHFEWTDSEIALNGPHAIVGRSVIVHAGEDDLTSQPTGKAGPRLACGIIGIVGK